jgi:hypothetical protein
LRRQARTRYEISWGGIFNRAVQLHVAAQREARRQKREARRGH